MKKTKFFMAMALGVSLALSGCSASSKVTTETETETAIKSKDGEMTITLWYEGGDARLPFFKEVEANMQKDYPNYKIEAVTFDNSTFMTKVLQATAATGGVDLVFNDASRLLEIHQQTNDGFLDLSQVLNANSNKALIQEGDIKLSSKGETLVVMPVNRTIVGLGVKEDVEGVSVTQETLPTSWKKFVELGEQYKAAGLPGFTMHMGVDPGQVFNLFMCGSGMSDIWLDGTPLSTIEKNKKYFEDIVGIYANTEGFWDKDATSEDFAAMYNKIQSGSVGMFRVGNWNAGNWDKSDSGVGAYAVSTFPSLEEGGESGLVLLNTRGFAIPKNASNVDAAKVFLSYVLDKEPQTKSFETMGSCMDLSVVDQGALSKNQKIFFDPNVKLFAIDNYVTQISYYNELKDVYEKGIVNALNSESEEAIKKNIQQMHTQISEIIEKK